VNVTWVSKEGKRGSVQGQFRIGSYNITPEGLTRWGCLDLDGAGSHATALADPLDVALQILVRCERLGLPAYLERSGGGQGWHIWLFFLDPVPAEKVRKLLFALIPVDAVLSDGTPANARENKGIEVFPKQDAIPADGYGNMVWLPWWHGAAPGGNRFYQVNPDGELTPFVPEGFDLIAESDLELILEEVIASPTGQGTSTAQQGPAPAPRSVIPSGSGRVAAETLLQRALQRTQPGSRSGRNDTGFWLACQLRDNGYAKAEAAAVLQRYAAAVPQEGHPYQAREAHASLDSAYSRPARQPWQRIARVSAPFTTEVARTTRTTTPGANGGGNPAAGQADDSRPENGEPYPTAAPSSGAVAPSACATEEEILRLLESAESDPSAAIDAALQPPMLATLAGMKTENPGRLEAVFRALTKGGAKVREVTTLRQAVKEEAKRQKRERALQQAAPGSPSRTVPTGSFGNSFAESYPTPDGGTETHRVGLALQGLFARLMTITKGWPKRVGPLLFVPGADQRPLWLRTHPDLFAYIARRLPSLADNPIHWAAGEDMVTRDQFFAYLQQIAEAYEAVEPYPHHPPLAGHYYLHPQPQLTDRQALWALLDRFSPASPLDADLILALFLSLLWGGQPGQRPAWLITAKEDDVQGGRGVGKSSLPKWASYLVGGAISISAEEPMDKVMPRLLSTAALDKRVAILDNIKALRFSWADLEGLITAPVISGRQLYVGEGRRPNTLTWFLTLNGASLSRDMAQRCVIIKLARPQHDARWEDEARAFIDAYRWEIIADILTILHQPAEPLKRYSRWGAWEEAVLARVPEPAECQKVIEERQGAVDDDAGEAGIVRDAFYQELWAREHDPDADVVFIPSGEAAAIVNAATGERFPTNRASSYLATLAIPELKKSDRGAEAGGRGWLWTGKHARPSTQAQVIKAKQQWEPYRQEVRG
jgi:hypothetical protein